MGESEPHGVGEVPRPGHTGPASIHQSCCFVPIGPLPCPRAPANPPPVALCVHPSPLGNSVWGSGLPAWPCAHVSPRWPPSPRAALGRLAVAGSLPSPPPGQGRGQLSFLTPGDQRPLYSRQASGPPRLLLSILLPAPSTLGLSWGILAIGSWMLPTVYPGLRARGGAWKVFGFRKPAPRAVPGALSGRAWPERVNAGFQAGVWG